jgi:hypothetical protein
VWTREDRRTISHDLRDLSDKESQRWISTALAAKPLLAGARMVTVLGDRESDIFCPLCQCGRAALPRDRPQHA